MKLSVRRLQDYTPYRTRESGWRDEGLPYHPSAIPDGCFFGVLIEGNAVCSSKSRMLFPIRNGASAWTQGLRSVGAGIGWIARLPHRGVETPHRRGYRWNPSPDKRMPSPLPMGGTPCPISRYPSPRIDACLRPAGYKFLRDIMNSNPTPIPMKRYKHGLASVWKH